MNKVSQIFGMLLTPKSGKFDILNHEKYKSIDEFKPLNTEDTLNIFAKICNAKIYTKKVNIGVAGHIFIYDNEENDTYDVYILYDEKICFNSSLTDIKDGEGICKYRMVIFKELLHLALAINYKSKDNKLKYLEWSGKTEVKEFSNAIAEEENYKKNPEDITDLAIKFIQGKKHTHLQIQEDAALILCYELICPLYLIETMKNSINKYDDSKLIEQFIIDIAKQYKILKNYLVRVLLTKDVNEYKRALKTFASEYYNARYINRAEY